MNLTWLYVAVVYAAAVWLARRGGAGLPWRIALFFYAIVLLFLWPVLTQDTVNFSVDCIKGLPPWTYLHREHYVINGELNDLPLQIVPWAHQVRESWKSLALPLWNPLAGGGYPLLANGQSSAFSMIRILALPLSLGHAMSAEAAMKLLIAMTFTWLYCRGRYSELASVIAAVSFGLSGFLIGWMHFPHATVASLAPAVLYCIDRLAERRSYGRFVFGAVIGAVILFGGHPETAAHLFLLAVGYTLWIVIVERPHGLERLRFLKSLAAAGAVAILLASPYLVMLLEAMPKSMRYRELSTSSLSSIVGHGHWRSTLLLLQPHFYGQLPHDRAWGPARVESVSGYAGVLGAAAFLALLVHLIATRRWRSRETFFVLATIAVFGVISNWPVVRHILFTILPIAANSRLRLLLVLLLSIQIAAAIDLSRRVPTLIGIAAVSAVLFALLQIVEFPAAYWRDTAILAMLPSLAVLALAALATLTARKALLLPLLLVAVVTELSMFGRDFNPAVPDRLAYPRTPLIDALDQLRAKHLPNETFRVAGTGGVLYPNTHAIFGYEDIRMHDPMANRRYVDFLTATLGFEVEGRYHPWWEMPFDPPVLDFLNVRYVMTYADGPAYNPAHFRAVYEGRDGRILENRNVLPRFFAVRNVVLDYDKQSFRRRLQEHNGWPHTAFLDWLTLENRQQHDDFFNPRPADSPLAKARIITASPTDYRIRVSAPRYSLVASSVPWWPGWKVARNGKRVDPIRVNGAFLGFAVPAGETDVRVWYDPWSFRLGAIIALATILGLIVFGRMSSRS